jgi:hypothetical protein
VAQFSNDPMETASNATLAPRTYYGVVDVDAYFCVLVKGTGKVLWDANSHGIDERRTSIKLTITPIAESGRPDPMEREMIAESREWVQITWASLKALGVTSVRDIKGKYAKVTFAPTGRKWFTKEGEEREATTYKFLALYDSEDACRAAWGAESGGNGTAAPAATPDSSSAEKATAYEFLRVLVNTHKNDRAALATTIASIPQISKWFTVDSPETVELLKKAS